MKIVKHSGSIVDFNRDKLKSSLLKSGADKKVVEDVLQVIEKQVYDGISTKKIYKLAFNLLKKSSHSHAARYNLRAALQLLGPAGFSLKNILPDYIYPKVIWRKPIFFYPANVSDMK